MKATFNRSHFFLALCVVALTGCTGTNEQASEKTSPMPGIAMVDKVCSMCHGLTGESISPMFPKLAGQQKEYLKLQLADFKGHARSDVTGTQYMWGFTHLTETQISELADYFSSQSPMKADDDKPDARGELIFRKGLPESGIAQCSSCHGADGQGNGQFPRLAGQHAYYMIRQIKVFQQTDQRPRGALMKQVTHSLSDADAEAVAHYIATLGAKK
ncbi:cytochrome c [Pseudomonas sp. H3(2019)]|uniref:c-type cytochrome n=1 Tax=Pseudomonas sp. H3(2019) TaxID=2598724 RepID=UPI0021147F50|nr:c-type cytochrome [Pseudomonas sp. H3(2019)]